MVFCAVGVIISFVEKVFVLVFMFCVRGWGVLVGIVFGNLFGFFFCFRSYWRFSRFLR